MLWTSANEASCESAVAVATLINAAGAMHAANCKTISKNGTDSTHGALTDEEFDESTAQNDTHLSFWSFKVLRIGLSLLHGSTA